MSLILPFIYYSGITGWNGYLYYSRQFTSIVLDGNLREHDIHFSFRDKLNLHYSKGSGLIRFGILFRNVEVIYFYPDEFYSVMGGIRGRWGKLFLGINSDLKPSLSVFLEKGTRWNEFGVRIRGMVEYHGGYEVPLGRRDAWGYRRHEIRDPVAYSIMLMGSYRLVERVVYAGFMPVGKKGMDLLIGVQYFNEHVSAGTGIRFFYPVLGSFHIFAGVEPASGRWDLFLGMGEL